MFLGENDELSRVNIPFAGFADILNRYPERLAFISGVPVTRFLSRSPGGQNATGESDRANYNMEVEAQRERQVQDPVDFVDAVIARDEGQDEAPEHEWPSLYESSDKERADVRKVQVETISTAIQSGAISEQTGAVLMRDMDEMFEDIPDAPEPLELPMPGMDPNDPNAPPQPPVAGSQARPPSTPPREPPQPSR